MDIITMLKEDNTHVTNLLDQLEDPAERIPRSRTELLMNVERSLHLQFALEADLLYPAIRAVATVEGATLTLRAHASQESLLALVGKLKVLSTWAEMWKATVTVLKDGFDRHMERNGELFKLARSAMTRSDLEAMAGTYTAMKHGRGAWPHGGASPSEVTQRPLGSA